MAESFDINSKKIYQNKLNFEGLVSEFMNIQDGFENINNLLKDIYNKHFLLQKIFDKYSVIEDHYNVLKYKYESLYKLNQELNENHEKLKSNSSLENKLLKYELNRMKIFNENIEKSHNITNQEYKKLKESTLCLICQENKRNVVLLPCRHYIICQDCENINYNLTQNRKCPLCRDNYNDKILLYT